jgi:TPR repeat protein
MADVAQPKPGDIAPQQSSRLDSADRGKLRVFISYSRDDLRFADQLDAALNACGFECVIDRHGISGGEDWKQRLGGLISEADTVTKKEVFALFQEGADRGNATSMTNLGWLYDNGFGVAQDYAKAREWYEKAADKGDADAMVNLGVLYDNGRSVAQDYAKAREWWEKAAAKDNASAMFNLGLLYDNGRSVAQDYAKAREWYEKAASQGQRERHGQPEKTTD